MLATFAQLLALVSVAAAHGQVFGLIASSGYWSAPDSYGSANASSPFRKIDTNGFVLDFTGPNLTCGNGGNIPSSVVAPIKAGETVTFDWRDWSSVHSGPMMTYIAKCPNGCANFKGDSGAVWVKIDQDQYNPDRTAAPWGENILHKYNSKYSVVIPKNIDNGEYILRHELLGLHTAGQRNGAQFYPNCVQVSVSGGAGGALPTGVALPGAYQPDDKGILVELWRIEQSPTPGYRAPGGPVLLSGGTGDWGVDKYGGHPALPGGSSGGTTSAAPAPAPTTTAAGSPGTTTKPATTTKPTTSAAPPAQTGAVVQKYGQCGGKGYTGSTNCASGSTCTASNEFYSQCL